jgi:type II secretory pathway component PulF
MALIITPGQFTQRAELYHQLAQLTAAGIGVVQALEQLQRNPPSRSFREPLRRQIENIKQGSSFTDSLLATSGWLPDFDIALIEAGERSGRMDDCFRVLADYYHERARITKQTISQMAYPVGLIHFAALVFLIIVPFAGSQFNASLTMLFLKAALILSPLYLGTALMIFALQSKHGEGWRSLMERVLRFVPFLGKARYYLALSRLSLALEALINAGVNIIQAWELAAHACGSPALRRVILAWRPQVESGITPAAVVSNCPQFPEMFANFYNSGEISGKLDEALARLHRYYNDEGNRKLQVFAEWTPRVIYGIVAAIIAYKIIQFYTGYFKQISTITNGF